MIGLVLFVDGGCDGLEDVLVGEGESCDASDPKFSGGSGTTGGSGWCTLLLLRVILDGCCWVLLMAVDAGLPLVEAALVGES